MLRDYLVLHFYRELFEVKPPIKGTGYVIFNQIIYASV